MEYKEILRKLKSLSNPAAVAGMTKYGINPKNNYGISVSALRSMAKAIGTNHALAEKLWFTGIHDARILASIIDDPEATTEEQLENWVKDFDSWDVCDEVCQNLFGKTRFAYAKSFEWSRRSEEFVKRAGFVLIVRLAVHNREMVDDQFVKFLPVIAREATDDRNYVRKAVNWTLRQIGKRSLELNSAAIETANRLLRLDSKIARWIASGALRELTDSRTRERIMRRQVTGTK